MGFSRSRIIKIALTLIFLCCMFFANFFALRLILRYGVDAYFYDKLLVAYTIGGAKGLKLELDKISITDKSSRESMLANNFVTKLETLVNPKAFLQDKVQENKKMIFFIRNLRSAAIVIMLILFTCKLFLNYNARFKLKKSS